MDKCPKCGRKFEAVAYGNGYVIFGCTEHREYDKTLYLDSLFTICEDDVWSLAKNENINVPEEKKADVLYTVKKAIESYCFEGAYTVWDAIKDAVREALEE